MSDDLSSRSGSRPDFLAGLRDRLEADVAEDLNSVSPDFASMIAAAHHADPNSVPLAWVEEAESLAPIVGLRVQRERDLSSRSGRPDPVMISESVLDGLIAGAREQAETEVAERRLRAVPDFAAPAAPARRGWSSVAALAAVGVGLVLGLPWLRDRLVDATQSEGGSKNQAEFLENDRGDERTQPAPRMERVVPQAREAINVPPPEPEAPPLPTREVEVVRSVPPSDTAAVGRTLAERVAALDDEAQRQWAAGELETAEETFRAILKLAGTSRHADLAYGDLFTLTHQRKDAAAELALWSEYLDRFPHGRFADDARAGLCRRGPDDERRACWQAYVVDFPTGVHVQTATRALSETP